MSTANARPIGSLRVIASDIKIAHSVFALPFAVLAAVMAAHPPNGMIDWRRFGGQITLIVLAMIFARTFAMLANRWLDREIDARNPRTAGRALPSGRLSPRAALTAMGASALAFVLVCAGFGLRWDNWWPLSLALPVLAWIGAYGLAKRRTAWCHVHLGSSLAISPLAAALAVEPAALVSQPALWLLAAMVLFWVVGFDIIYGLQDEEVDRAEGLHSIPARFGAHGAMMASRAFHVLCLAALVIMTVTDPRLGTVFTTGVIAVAGLLVYEHLTVHRWGSTRIALTFFTLNGLISCLLGALGLIDVLMSD